ncbi:MAG TPA: hypothetical protein VL251_00205 [Thermomonas sp.]|jgi:hypothetical protein|nr:hypothetical protein [Thermomonas sp.]
MPTHQIAMFTFTLGKDESIGPGPLRSLWARASGTSEVGVSRRDGFDAHRDRPVYTLYAPQGLPDLAAVERRIRHLLEAAHLHASLTPLHV